MSAGPVINHDVLRENSRGSSSLNKSAKSKTVNKNMFGYIAVVGIVALCVVLFLFSVSKDNAQVIYLDGVQVGVLGDIVTTEEDILSMLQQNLEMQKHTEVQINSKVTLEPVRASKKVTLMSESDLINKISENLSLKIEATTIFVDGVAVGSMVDDYKIEAILNGIKSKYIQEGVNYVTEAGFLEEIVLEKNFILENELSEFNELGELLNSNKNIAKTHTIVSGDTLFGLAIENNISLKEILQANPELEENSILKLGSEINLVVVDPFLSVVTYEEATFTEIIPKTIEIVENNEEYQTHYKVLTSGSDGLKEVFAEVVRVNGSEADRVVIVEKLIEEAVVEVVEIGMLQTPPKKSVGSFIYPISGTLTSGYGQRWGTLHKGIDLAASYNTPIKASDGGTVVYSGWYSGYGNCVKIDHGNGLQTLYGHNSRNVVDVGQKVAQGEVIAYVGSTGNSTGNHVHFEILLNGVAMNPMNYL